MRKGVKILLIVLAVLLALGIAVFIGADVWVSRYVKKHVDKALAELPFGEASCGEIQIRLFSGTAGVSDLAFSYPPNLEVHVDHVELGRFFYSTLLAHQISVTDIRITHPAATIVYDSKHPDDFFPEIDDRGLDRIGDFLVSAELFRLKIDNACLFLRDKSTNMEIAIDSADVHLHDLSYNWQDSTFRYNDSVFDISVDAFRFFDPKEPMRFEAHDICLQDQTGLTTGAVQFNLDGGKRQPAANEHNPATWIDLKVNSIHTSPFTPFPQTPAKDPAYKISVTDIRITHPVATIVYDSKHPDDFFQKTDNRGLDKTGGFPVSAELSRLKVDDACLSLRDRSTNMEIALDSANVQLEDLSYNGQNSAFGYNDSVYDISVKAFRFFDPKEPMRFVAHDICLRDQNGLTTGAVQFKHACDKRKLAAHKREPATWIDLKANSLRTSPFNLFRKALAKDLSLDSVTVDIKDMDIFRDSRIAPRKPFPMPQTVLLKQPVDVSVKHVSARVQKLDIEYASTDVAKGEMHLRNIRAAVENANNHKGNTIRIHGNCPIDKGRAEADMRLTLNRACDWNVKLHVTDVNTNYLNSFTRPLVGITCDCHVDDLTANYTGNSVKADGTFRMLYHGLNVKVYKDDNIPYQIISKNADSFTTLGNTLIPKSNPTSVDIRPRAYEVEWRRDEWKPFPLFLFGPCIDGAKKTMLPGLYVHKQVKAKKINYGRR